MIDLEDLKLYLNLSVTRDKDTILLSSIRQATSILESLFNRELVYGERTEFTDLNILGRRLTNFYLTCYPVFSISSIQKYNCALNAYDDLILPVDIPSSTLFKPGGEILNLRSISPKHLETELKVVYIGGYRNIKGNGTISTTLNSNVITGSGTNFIRDNIIGDEIKVNGIIRKVTSISSTTLMTVSEEFFITQSGQEYRISNVPEDLQQGITYLAALNYLSSSFAHESTGLSSVSVNLSTLDDNNLISIIDGNRYLIPSRYTFTSLDLKNLINKYRRRNI